MRKLLTLGCLGAATVLGGAAAAQACDDEPRVRTHGYSYSYAPRAYGYGPAYYYDDDDYYAYGYGPSVGVDVYSDFNRRGRRFHNRAHFRDRGDRIRTTRVSDRSEGSRGGMSRGPGRSSVGGGGDGSPRASGGGGMMGGGGGRGGDGGRGR